MLSDTHSHVISLLSLLTPSPNRARAQIKAMNKDEMDAPIAQDFDQSISKVQPSVGKGDLKRFETWMAEYGAS